MATNSWSAGVSGAWTDASKWSLAAVPGARDDALIAEPLDNPDQPASLMGTIEGFTHGATIDLGLAASPVSYSGGDLKLPASGSQMRDLYIAGPYSLANLVAVTQDSTTAIEVNGSVASTPVLQGAGNAITYVASGAAVAIAPGLAISESESATLTGATVSVSSGAYPEDGDLLSAITTDTGIMASFNATTEVLTLSGLDTLANYQSVLRSVAFGSSAADPTMATSNPNRTISWVINDGTATSAPVTSIVNLQPPPRVLTWVGTQGSSIFTAANWNDTTNSVNPANLAPDAADSALFEIDGGTITGAGTIGSIAFAGGNDWLLGSGTSLNAVDGIGDSGGVTLVSGATVISQGNLDSVSAFDGNTASLTISGTNGLWHSLGALIIGEQSASGALTIENRGALISGGLVVAQAGGTGTVFVASNGSLQVASGPFVIGAEGLGSLVIASGGDASVAGDASIAGEGADGSSASVTGAGSTCQIAGALQLGNGAAGALDVAGGGTVTAAALDAGVQNVGMQQGVGQIDVIGSGSQIDIGGNAIIGDAGRGTLSILGGGTLTATNLVLGNATGDGTASVSGNGSLLDLSGTLSIGVTLGIGELTIGSGATVAADTAVLQNHVMNRGGTFAASQIEITSGATLEGFGIFGSPNARITNDGTFSTGGGVAVGNGSIAGAGAVLIGNGSTLDLTGGVVGSQSVAFTTSAGALIVQHPGDFHGVITQFAAGDQIFVEAPFSGSFRQQGSIVQVLTAGDVVGALDFATTALATEAATTPGALVYDIVPCFAAGTRIMAKRGDVAVEGLFEGEYIEVLGGRASRIIWIGHRTIDCTKHPSPEKVWPVRVRTGAFGLGKPCRDLWLSPDHAVFIAETLIPVKYLTNGASIAQVAVRTITYYHVELPQHAVLLAEGLPVESYLDTGDRTNFANGGGVMTLHPDFSSRVRDAEGCAPLVVTGHELDAARLMVNALAFLPLVATPP